MTHERRARREASVLGDPTQRTRLINDICCLIREPRVPEEMRTAGLALIGFLARRMPGEDAHELGVEECKASVRARPKGRR
jgi:hypothetical protein